MNPEDYQDMDSDIDFMPLNAVFLASPTRRLAGHNRQSIYLQRSTASRRWTRYYMLAYS